MRKVKETKRAITLADIREYLDYNGNSYDSLSEQLPFCCGVNVIGVFLEKDDLISLFNDAYSNAFNRDVHKHHEFSDATKITEVLKCAEEVYREDHIDRRMINLASLSTYQYDLWKPVLNRLGFRPVHEFKNPNTGNFVTLFMRKPD